MQINTLGLNVAAEVQGVSSAAVPDGQMRSLILVKIINCATGSRAKAVCCVGVACIPIDSIKPLYCCNIVQQWGICRRASVTPVHSAIKIGHDGILGRVLNIGGVGIVGERDVRCRVVVSWMLKADSMPEFVDDCFKCERIERWIEL